jgi:hypothetical protein
LAFGDTVGIVEVQNRHCDSSFRGQWLDDGAFPGKVGHPVLGAWIEQRHQPPCLWIKRTYIGTFVPIAPQARPRQVLQMVFATVLTRHNVIGLVRMESESLR